MRLLPPRIAGLLTYEAASALESGNDAPLVLLLRDVLNQPDLFMSSDSSFVMLQFG